VSTPISAGHFVCVLSTSALFRGWVFTCHQPQQITKGMTYLLDSRSLHLLFSRATGKHQAREGSVGVMDTETRRSAIEEVIAEYRSTLPIPLGSGLSEQETANRIYVAVTLQPSGLLAEGVRSRVRDVDAMCARAGVRHITSLIDNDILRESLDRCVLPYFSEPRGLLHDRGTWALSVLRGHDSDARTMWEDRTPDEAFDTLTVMTTSTDAAHWLVLNTNKGVPASNSYPDYATRCAVRLGLVEWSESFVTERLEAAFHTMLCASEEPDLLPALCYLARSTCRDDPSCSECRSFSSCWYLCSGFA